MIPRNALSKAVASRAWRSLQRPSLRLSHTATASAATQARPGFAHSAFAHDTDLRSVFDEPFSHASSSSLSLAPTGLFGNSWLQRPENFISLANVTILKARAIVGRITNAPNAGLDEMRMVVKNFDRLSDVLCGVIDTAELVRHAHPDPEWAEAANEAYEILCSYMNVLNTHPALYNVLSEVMADDSITSTFTPEERAVALIFQRDFERSGIDLPPAQREQFVALSSEIITLGRHFLIDGPGPRGYVDLPIAKLQETVGTELPANDKRGQRRAQELLDALKKRVSRFTGKVRVHGGTWEAHMLLRYCSHPDIRRDLYVAGNKENSANVETLESLLRARSKLAQLVGKNSYAEMSLTDKMAKNPDHVDHFLRALAEHHRPLALAEVSQFAALKAARHQASASTINAWDKEYYSARLQSSLSPTPSSSRPPSVTLGTVFQGLSELFGRVFGLRLRVVDASPGESWHPDVRKLEAYSVDDGSVIGWIFADLFARAGKQSGAAHYTVRCSRRLDGDDWLGDIAYHDRAEMSLPPDLALLGPQDAASTMRPQAVNGKEGVYQLPIAVLSCDFARPSIAEGASMLNWHEVETLFHEMGHALHSMVGQTEYHNVAGTRCATDFVELPSILMEHFLASPAVQSLLLGRPLDSSIASSRSRGASPALDAHGQILLAMLDQAYHSPSASSPSFSSTATLASLNDTLGVIPYAPGTAWQMQFSHLYGYGATYYSYLFDQAIASRVFKKVFAADPLDRESGDRYVKEVLRWGGGKDPWTMVGRLLEDDEIIAGDRHAMEMVGRWGIDAHTSISQ